MTSATSIQALYLFYYQTITNVELEHLFFIWVEEEEKNIYTQFIIQLPTFKILWYLKSLAQALFNYYYINSGVQSIYHNDFDRINDQKY